MLIDSDDHPFPRRSDIETLLEDGSYEKIQTILAGRGVHICGKKHDIPSHIVRFAFGEEVYKRAFDTFTKAVYGISISGLRAQTNPCLDLSEFLRSQIGIANPYHKYEPQISQVFTRGSATVVKVQYTKLNPRFADFRRRDTYEIEITVRHPSSTEVELRTFPKNSADSLVARDIILQIYDQTGYKPIVLDLEALPVQARVDLFDSIINTSGEWRVQEASGFTIRAADSSGDSWTEEGSDGCETDTHLTETEVRLLQSAILEGRNLREHKIVQDLLADSSFFSAATFWVSKQSQQGINQLRLRIDFKRKPRVLVISIAAEGREPTESGDGWNSWDYSYDLARECTEYFWNEVHLRYKEQYDRILSLARTVQRNEETTPVRSVSP